MFLRADTLLYINSKDDSSKDDSSKDEDQR